MPRSRRRLTAVGAAILALLLQGCYEDPVIEELHLRLLAGGNVTARYRVKLDRQFESDRNTEFTQRLAALERGLTDGSHPWLQRFDRLQPESDGSSWQRNDGRLARFERWMLSATPSEELPLLLADTSVSVQLNELDDLRELLLFAAPSQRADGTQLRLVQDAFRDFAEVLRDYLTATIDVWRHIEAEPRRAGLVMAGLFDELEEDQRKRLRPDEVAMIERFEVTGEQVLEIFELEKGQAHTLQELSRLVYDPFPARFTIEPSGELIALEGFVEHASGILRVPSLSFWDSIVTLEGRWLAPDPLLAMVAYVRTNSDEPFDVESFLDQDFFYAQAPSEREVIEALEDVLRPEPSYRVLWRPHGS